MKQGTGLLVSSDPSQVVALTSKVHLTEAPNRYYDGKISLPQSHPRKLTKRVQRHKETLQRRKTRAHNSQRLTALKVVIEIVNR